MNILILLALSLAADATELQPASVSIRLDGLPSGEGVVYVGLCTEHGWETFNCANAMLDPSPDGVAYAWKDVTPGIYGITVLHDENRNGKMDFDFFGAPKEKWGSSNNPPPRMGRSLWKDVAFEVAGTPVTMTINMQ
ncbi:MAG: DUF2141 domain-containing protein [Pseudomonadota bacterium]